MNVVDVVVVTGALVVEVVVLMLGLFVKPPPPAFSELPGPVVVVVVDDDVDVDVVSTQLGLFGTWAQLGSATAETAETAITAANIAATVRSTNIRFTLIHPPFLYSFFPTNLDAGAGRLVSALPLATNKCPAPCRTRVLR